jgi:hypothetical protein
MAFSSVRVGADEQLKYDKGDDVQPCENENGG